jgi:RimJ/RimL family protein N-acetyltransferase
VLTIIAPSTMQPIRTPRLRLHLRSPDELRAELAAIPAELRVELSPSWLERVEGASASDPWLHGFRAVADDGHVIGQGGFKAPPEAGMVEIAYMVDSGHQHRGYATEIAAGLTAFAFSFADVNRVWAHTLVAGAASQRVLVKCGFRNQGEVVDPDDGVVLRFEQRRPPA